MKIGILFIFISSFFWSFGQNVHIVLQFHGESLVPEKNYYSAENSDSLKIETLRFYISDLVFLRDNEVIGQAEKKYILVDMEQPASLSVPYSVNEGKSIDKIRFNLGIDSLTNVSGVMGGDLDPTMGMYWAWQSGYINFKLEGSANSCPARQHRFQYHLGGYMPPFNSMQTVDIEVPQNTKDIQLIFAIDQFMEHVRISENYQVMSPGEKAIALSKILPEMVSVGQ